MGGYQVVPRENRNGGTRPLHGLLPSGGRLMKLEVSANEQLADGALSSIPSVAVPRPIQSGTVRLQRGSRRASR